MFYALSIRTSRSPVAPIGWVFWAVFVFIWVISLIPFFAAGMNLVSDRSLQYAGGGYARFGIPYAPLPEDVYGTSGFADIAQFVVCFGPCLFALAIGGVSWGMSISWRSYSRVGMVLRVAALAFTFELIAVSYRMAATFLTWGLG